MNEHHILMTIRTTDTFIDTMTKAVAGARGRVDGPIEATGVSPTLPETGFDLLKALQLERKARNTMAATMTKLKQLLRKVLEHADIGHVWNIHEHCDAKYYEQSPCTCGLAELEEELKETLEQP